MDKLDYDNLITDEHILGIQFLPEGVKVIEIFEQKGTQKLFGYGSSRYPLTAFSGGVVRDTEIVSGAILDALSTAKPNKIVRKFANVALPDSKVFVRVVKFPSDMSKQEIQESLQFKAKTLIAMPIEKVYWDWHRVETNEKKKETTVVLAAADKECVDSIIETLDKAQIIPLSFEVNANAAARVLFKEKYNEKQAIFVRYESGVTSFDLYIKGGVRFNTASKVGYSKLISVLAKGLKIDIETARDWILASQNIPESKRKQVSKLFETQFVHLHEEVANIVSYGEQAYPDEFDIKHAKVILFGEGAKIYQLKDSLKAQGYKVELAKPELESLSSTLHYISGRDVFSHLILLGLGVRNIGIYRKQRGINIVPNAIKKNYFGTAIFSRLSRYLRFITWNIFILLVIVLSFGMFLGIYEQNLDAELLQVQSVLNSEHILELNYSIISANNTAIKASHILDRDIDWEVVFTEFDKLKSDHIVINSIGFSTAPESVSDSTPSTANSSGDKYIFLLGIAESRKDALDFASTLESSSLFSGISMPLNTIQDAPEVSFQFSGRLKVDAIKKLQDEMNTKQLTLDEESN